MHNFVFAFFATFCLVSFCFVALATGLGLVNPFLGVLALISCVIGIFSTSSSID